MASKQHVTSSSTRSTRMQEGGRMLVREKYNTENQGRKVTNIKEEVSE